MNLDNNFGVFILSNFEIPNADFQSCMHYNTTAIDTCSGQRKGDHIEASQYFNCNNFDSVTATL